MRNQEIIWTALPNGRKADVFQLSVHVAPRLITDEGLPDPRLQGFKDFMNWPANALTFKVQLGGAAPVSAKVVTAPPASNDLWIALFRPDTFVRPHKFDAPLSRKVRSYPVRHIRNFVKDLYTQLVTASPTDHPDFSRLMSPGDGPRQRSFADISFVDPASLKEDRKGRLLEQLENEFPIVDRERQLRGGAIPFNPNDPPVKSFLQLEKFHQPPPAIFRLASLGEGVTQGSLGKWLVAPGDAVAIDQLLVEVQTAKGPVKLLSPWAGTVRSINKLAGSIIRVRDPLLAEPGAPVASAVTMTRDFVKKLDSFNKKPTLKDSGPEGAVDFHQVLSFAANHPTLMRLLGLVVDLEFKPVPPVPTGPSTVQVSAQWKPQLSTTKDFFPITRCLIDAARFQAAPRAAQPELVDGAFPLENQDRYEIVEIDHDGVGLKTMHFADNLGRSRLPQHLTDDTPKSYAPPSLRSGGLSVARVGHATKLVESFQRSKSLNDNFKTGPILLDAEDVTRGFVVHVFDSKTAKWHSLTQRMGSYEFLNKPETVPVEDEAAIIIGPTSSFDGSTPDLYQQETLFRWAGWSLAAPRPGKALVLDPAHDPGGHSQRIESVAAEDFKLQIRFTAKKGSLPRLRFGVQYHIRARAVDLAGNRPDFGDPKAPDPHATRLITYARFEPVEGPILLLRKPRSMGESVERMVIRSNYNEAAETDNQRHLSPPKTSQLLAEEHGLFDTAGGIDHNAFALIGARENKSYQTAPQGKQDPLDLADSRFFDVDELPVPFLPDPLARGVAFGGLPGGSATDILQMGFLPSGKSWPEFANIRITLMEGPAPKSQPSADGRGLKIFLPKAEVVTVRYSCFVNLSDLELMGVWLWLDESQRKKLQDSAVKGQLWALTPARELVLVHAVRQPLKTPEFDRLAAGKVLGQTFAALSGLMSFSRKSTATIKVLATWPEAIDEGPGTKDPTGPPPLQPHAEQRGFAVDVPLVESKEPGEDKVAFQGLQHEFHDTKYRRVTYKAVASTKFGEYFALRAKVTLTGTAPIRIDAAFVPGTVRVTALDLKATFNLNTDYALDYAKGTIARINGGRIQDGDTVWIVYQVPPTTRETEKLTTIDVLNSGRPAAPKVLYVLPTWGFTQKKGARGTIRSQRRGGGLRVYLDRPWWSSGDGELLGVVLFRPTSIFQLQPPDPLKPYVTQWGVDPIHSTGPTSLFPTLDRFPLREVEPDRLVTLDERPPGTDRNVHVAGHQVDFDPERKLWFCDIDITTDRSYWPFIRLALARYQPKSITDAHISRVLLADFAQIAPDRTVLITFNSVDATRFRVSVFGLSFTGTRAGGGFRGGPGVIRAHIEQRSDKFGGELAWEALGEPVTLASSPVQGGGTIWEHDMQLPRRKWPFRLVLEETEPLDADARPPDGDPDKPVQRLVFTDVLALTPDEVGTLSVSPTILDFGGFRVGKPSAQRTVMIENVGNAPLQIGNVLIEGTDAGDFAITSDLASRKKLNPGGKASVRVRFTPTKPGPRAAQLRVPSDGVGTGTVQLKGVGQSPELEIMPPAVDFGAQLVGATSDPKTITLRNAGNADLQLGSIELQGPNKGDFDIITDPSGQLVPPGGQVKLDIAFTPAALGLRNATVSIPSDAPGSPHTVPLRGVGGIPKASVSPTAFDFGDQVVGRESPSKVATVSNTGTGPLIVSGVDIVGPNPDSFFIFDAGPGVIPPGGSGNIEVRFFPLATGPLNATLRIEHNAPGGALMVALKGRGIAPAVTLQPPGIDFGDQLVGTDSPAKTLTVKNVGSADLHVSFIDFAGPAADDYSLGADSVTGATLQPGKTASFQVIFSPSKAGAREAVVLVANDAIDSPQSVPLTGKGIVPVASPTPTSLDFGNQTVGVDSAPRTVTIKNTGDADLHVDTVDIVGPNRVDFRIGTDALTGATIGPGVSRTVEVIFSPVNRGTKTASLQISHDGLDLLTAIGLKGVGVGPPGVTTAPSRE